VRPHTSSKPDVACATAIAIDVERSAQTTALVDREIEPLPAQLLMTGHAGIVAFLRNRRLVQLLAGLQFAVLICRPLTFGRTLALVLPLGGSIAFVLALSLSSTLALLGRLALGALLRRHTVPVLGGARTGRGSIETPCPGIPALP
jgi:hypothetical protein